MYTVEQIIQRKIHIPKAQVFTNGTIKDSEIKAAFFKLSRYIQECRETDKGKRQQCEREVIKKAFNGKDIYKDNNAAFLMIVSTDLHPSEKIVNECVKFYNSDNEGTGFIALNQNTAYTKETSNNMGKDIVIALSGSALKNIDTLYKKGYKKMRCYSNTRNVIEENDSYINITKTITVSANGYVYTGLRPSFESIDKDPICNIMKCATGEVVKKINEWCWKYPISYRQLEKIQADQTYIYKYDNGYLSSDDTPKGEAPENVYEACKDQLKTWEKYIEVIQETHRIYKYLTQTEAAELAGLAIAADMDTDEAKREALDIFCHWKQEITDSEIKMYIEILENENTIREAEADPEAAARKQAALTKTISNIITNKLGTITPAQQTALNTSAKMLGALLLTIFQSRKT